MVPEPKTPGACEGEDPLSGSPAQRSGGARAGGAPPPTSAAACNGAPLLRTGRRRRTFAALLEVTADNLAHALSGRGWFGRHRTGVFREVESELDVLPLTARAYLQDVPACETQVVHTLLATGKEFAARRYDPALARLRELRASFPLDAAGLSGCRAPRWQLRWAGRTYRQLCRGCHAYPDSRAPRPAPDLFRWARRLSAREFAARLIDGIHGTRFTRYENPFSPAELAAFADYFRGCGPPHRPAHPAPH